MIIKPNWLHRHRASRAVSNQEDELFIVPNGKMLFILGFTMYWAQGAVTNFLFEVHTEGIQEVVYRTTFGTSITFERADLNLLMLPGEKMVLQWPSLGVTNNLFLQFYGYLYDPPVQ